MFGPSLGLLKKIGKGVASKIGPKAIGRDVKKVIKKPGTPFKVMGRAMGMGRKPEPNPRGKSAGGIFGRAAGRINRDISGDM